MGTDAQQQPPASGPEPSGWLLSQWKVITATVVIVSGVWGFFYLRMVELKDERIEMAKEAAAAPAILSDLAESVRALEERIGPLTLALHVDPLTGQLRVGSGMATPTQLTSLLADGERAIEATQFDVATGVAERLEQIYPDFPGALWVRWKTAHAQEYSEEATRIGRELLERVPDDRRLLPVYTAIANHLLASGERREAESMALRALRLAPEDEQLRSSFKSLFGYEPQMEE